MDYPMEIFTDTFDQMSEFHVDNDWNSHVEHFEFYFEANDTTSKNMKRAILPTSVGNESYKFICCLLMLMKLL